MRSLSSTVSDSPSSWLPSRKVVSKISTAVGAGIVLVCLSLDATLDVPVGHEDVDQQAEGAARGQEETHDRDRRVAEQLGSGVDPHEQGGADDEGGHDQSGRDPVGQLLQTP